ncbi:pyrroline-5-carboxylate reductase [Parasphingorhabdus litoris]|uniref:Pyrroline-5-carboxylate reductase n=1 Tax=Parasphingorhabdus litoris TaxID=394733 RepID=A0ABN1A2E5_9SPHN|nr:pyrroline-5-carboxylate reductase [Parasphingorhabdus litoris]
MIGDGFNSIWFVGCGNMGGAILQAWLDNGLDSAKVTIVKPHQSPLPGGLQSQPDYPKGVSPDLVMLAMKPYQLDDVAADLAPLVGDNTHVVSVLAGTEIAILRKAFPRAGKIIRLMPNMAVTVAKSPMILISETDEVALKNQMDQLFSPLGPPEWLENEDQMHLATALSGSGPAFLFRFIDALSVSAAGLGMNKDQAARLALAMVDGAATLAAGSDDSPGELADQVASPNGVTRKGLDVLDADGRVNQLLHDVLKAAMERNREMAEEAKA